MHIDVLYMKKSPPSLLWDVYFLRQSNYNSILRVLQLVTQQFLSGYKQNKYQNQYYP